MTEGGADHDAGLLELGRHAAMLVHELRNVLTSVTTMAESIDLRDLPPEGARRLELLRNGARLCRRLVEDALLLGGRNREEPRSIPLRAWLTETVESFVPLPAGIRIELVTAEDKSTFVLQADRSRLALVNLLRNAVVAMTESGRQGTIHLVTSRIKGGLEIAVHDEGPGVPEALREHLFEAFAGASAGGTGLGLTAAKRMIEDQGGSIRLERSTSSGSTFVIFLPERQATCEAPSATGTPSSRRRRLEILVVDDDASSRESYAMLLALEGHQVHTASGAREALALLDRSRFDCIISDFRLRDTSGERLLQAIEGIDPRLGQRVIFVTGDLLNPTTRSFLDSRRTVWIAKPFEIDDLKQAIDSVVGPA